MRKASLFLVALALVPCLIQAVTVTVTPSDTWAARGQQVTVSIAADVDDGKLLGSFTGNLRWDSRVLQYIGHSGDFANLTVNDAGASSVLLRFAAADPYGQGGHVQLISVSFTVIGQRGFSDLTLGLTAMAAARTFESLLPAQIVNARLFVKHSWSWFMWPNPFNPVCNISYDLPAEEQVSITIYNMLGQAVKVLASGQQAAGRHLVLWDGTNNAGDHVPSGTYFCRMQAGAVTETRRITYLR